MNDKETVMMLHKKLKPILKMLGMSDWNIVISLELNKDKDFFAEVIPTYQIKSAKLMIYKLEDLEDTLTHEMLHCKISGLKEMYVDALDKYHNTIKDLMDAREETFINDLTKVILK